MTVASQIKQTLAALKGAQATLQTYAEHHPDQNIKAEFKNCENRLENMIQGLETRIQQIEFEEPQYKGY
ncbi:DUF1657 domain-containing protein [Caldalkalibacillus mannanilyticus]|uniref:DUF1657 domain-containing protein n=1 Tax=Caldalkalibacillus mannanilyticus TaxID=1418 RepID=UPI000469DDA5|nr:DUF1657 domain-containing protein [Caldalkalibacillus mannanilyticus]